MNKEEFKLYHEVDLLDFQKYIESIGFKYIGFCYRYKGFKIDLSFIEEYGFYNGSKWNNYEYNDLRPIENYFKQELRRIKLRKILG